LTLPIHSLPARLRASRSGETLRAQLLRPCRLNCTWAT